MPSLLVTHGYHYGVRFDVPDVCTIGRSSACSIQLLDEKVSRVHATVLLDGEGYQVRDEGSSNGTGLNGELLLQPGRLSAGDELAVGNNLMLFEPPMRIQRDRGGIGAAILLDRLDEGVVAEAGASRTTGESQPMLASSLLAAVGRVLASNRTAGLPWLVLEAIARGVGAERGIWFRAGEADGPQLDTLLTFPAQSRVAVPRELIQRTITGGKGLRLDDGLGELRVRGGRTRLETRPGSGICVPVPCRGRVRGALYLDTQVRGAFRGVPISLIEDLATTAFPMVLASLGIRTGVETVPDQPAPPVAESQAMREVVDDGQRLARTDVPVMLLGEAGSGREELARHIHAHSHRRRGPFAAVHCDTLSADRVEEALFGREKSADGPRFVGAMERARAGTLFLRDVDSLDASMQTKLQRVLQERRFYRQGGGRPVLADVRLITATRRDLTRRVRHEEFREDLYRALDQHRLDVPPLRERLADLPGLVQREIDAYNRDAGTAVAELQPEARQALEAYRWRGNVDELRALMRRVLIHTQGTEVTAAVVRQQLETQIDPGGIDQSLVLGQTIRGLDSRMLIQAVITARGRKNHAARILGISLDDLNRRLAEYGIDLVKEVGRTVY